MDGRWDYAQLMAVGGRWVIEMADPSALPPRVGPYAAMSEALRVLDQDGWLLDPRWQPEWPYVSLRRPAG